MFSSRYFTPAVAAVLLAGFCFSAGAQQAAPTGTVVGTITFADTQRPARFAKVTLTPVHSDANKALESLSEKDAKANPMAALGALMGSVTMLVTQTDLEGRYEITDVAPGDYYVLANAGLFGGGAPSKPE